MKKLKNPHLVNLLDVFETSNHFYIIQDFLDGGDLKGYLRRNKEISESAAITILKQILYGLSFLLRNGYVHRDLKPENVLFDIKSQSFKLCDFGLTKHVDRVSQEMMSSIVGTPQYMSPQLLK